MFICLLYAVYRTQLSKQPVIKNMLCKQNWNGGKTDCVHLAFCITNQAEGYSTRFSVCFSPKGSVTHCSVPMLLRSLKAFFFSFSFVKMWYFCRLYYLHCFSGSVKALPINLRNNLIWKDALSFLKEEDTRLTWNYGLAAIFFDEQHTAVHRSKVNLQLGDHLWSVLFLYAKSAFNFHRTMSVETKIPLLFPHCHSWPWPQ